MEDWGPLQASHLMEGPIGLRRNWNHRFLTLESEYWNKHRHTCAAVLLRRLAGGFLPPDIGEVARKHLVEAQLTGHGAQPQEGELTLDQGNTMLLAELYVQEVPAPILDGFADQELDSFKGKNNPILG